MESFKQLSGARQIIRSPYFRPIVVIVAIGLLFWVGRAFYSSWHNRVQESAHEVFVHALEYYNAPVRAGEEKGDEKVFATYEEKWQKVADVFSDAYKMHRSAGIAPLFNVFAGQAQLQLGNRDKAIELFEMSVPYLVSPPLRSYYEVMESLVLIDSDDEAKRRQGIHLLEQVAHDEASVAHPFALYELGYHHFITGAFDQAKNYWLQLVHKYGKTVEKPSEWADQAKKLLKLITA